MHLFAKPKRPRVVPDQYFQNPAGTGITGSLHRFWQEYRAGFYWIIRLQHDFSPTKIFIIHPRKYKARETKRKLPSTYLTVFCLMMKSCVFQICSFRFCSFDRKIDWREEKYLSYKTSFHSVEFSELVELFIMEKHSTQKFYSTREAAFSAVNTRTSAHLKNSTD